MDERMNGKRIRETVGKRLASLRVNLPRLRIFLWALLRCRLFSDEETEQLANWM